jgi:hypothetical protein
MRLARQIVRDRLRRQSRKPSHYARREIVLMAQHYVRERWPQLAKAY